MKDTVTAKALKCEIIKTEKGLPEFKVIDYTDPENISFTYEKGDIIKPDVVNDTYINLMLNVEQYKQCKSELLTSVMVYRIVERLDYISANTLKEVREGLNRKLQGKVAEDILPEQYKKNKIMI